MSTVRIDYHAAIQHAASIPSPRAIALQGAEDRSAEVTWTDWALDAVQVHTFHAGWAVRAKTTAARRHLAAKALGYESWEDVPADAADLAAKCKFYVPALRYAEGALLCARMGLRATTRATIDRVVGHHVRLNHPHEGMPYAALGVWAPAR